MDKASMNQCMEVATELKQYAQVNFTDSLHLKPGQNLTNPYALGLSFAEWIPIDKIGLEVPPTTIPPEIIPLRNQLTVTYLESIYYQSMTPGIKNKTYSRLYPYGNGYLDPKLLEAV